MKITDVKAYRLKTGQIFVEVFTDGGVTGMGEFSPTVNTVALAAIIENQIKRIALGRSPFDTEVIWKKVYEDHYKHGHQGVPCYMMMGGKVRDKVPLYASAMRQHRKPADEVKHLEKWVQRGFTSAKIHPYVTPTPCTAPFRSGWSWRNSA